LKVLWTHDQAARRSSRASIFEALFLLFLDSVEMMKNIVRVAVLAGVLVGGSATTASADVVFTLHDAKFTGGPAPVVDAGTLTGTFTLSDDLTTLVAVNLTASAAPNVGAYDFAEHTYTLSNATVATSLPGGYIRISQSSGAYQLELRFATALTSPGTTQLILDSSYEYQGAAGTRRVSAGTASAASTSAVPEP